MIIGVDGNEANVEKKVGVSVYTLELLRYFAKHANATAELAIFLRHPPLPHMPEQTMYFRYHVITGKVLWSQIFLPLYLKTKIKLDVYFAPAHYVPRFCPAPFVVTIHDLSYIYFPQEFLKKDLYKLTHWSKEAVEHAKHVIAVSKTTKKDILKHYVVTESNVSVVYNGYQKAKELTTKSSVLHTYSLVKQKYILYVGTVQPRKNIQTLLKAYAKWHTTHPDYKLVIVGKKGWLYEDIYAEALALDVNDAIIFTGYESDENLQTLYQHAFCFVLPSLYEGFGIPVLEAMAHGCPVIASHASSLPEIGGEACLYFDPKDAGDLIEKFDQLEGNTSLRQDLIKKGKKRLELFSWEDSAKQTLEILQASAKS
ncbi:MAG: glycosyltransferase family 4 protein [Weeksellaceae bacterium]